MYIVSRIRFFTDRNCYSFHNETEAGSRLDMKSRFPYNEWDTLILLTQTTVPERKL